jgi:hypothetical protein
MIARSTFDRSIASLPKRAFFTQALPLNLLVLLFRQDCKPSQAGFLHTGRNDGTAPQCNKTLELFGQMVIFVVKKLVTVVVKLIYMQSSAYKGFFFDNSLNDTLNDGDTEYTDEPI